ncbi:hypothetical protein EI613_17405 [Azospirillum sp. 412522]|nr:hypothetical protein [Azospirillum sp. 412522]MBY6263677.1 hypothetical protein [Azospirillum sp. 412522]
MSQSTSLCFAAGGALSPLSCKLQSAGCSVVRGVLDLLTMPSGNQRLLGWMGNHLLSVAGQLGGQLGNGAADLMPVHPSIPPTAAGSLLAAVGCAAILVLRSLGAATALAVLMLIGAYALTLQLPPDLVGTASGVEFLLIPALVAVAAAFRATAR